VIQDLKEFSSFAIESIPRRKTASRPLGQSGHSEEDCKGEEKGGWEGEQMVALHDALVRGVDGGRKSRAPQGSVVRNTDCPVK